jgi:hypothetical protein
MDITNGNGGTGPPHHVLAGNGHARPGRLTKGALACLAVNAGSGAAARQCWADIAQDYGVSRCSLYRARRLTPLARQEVIRSERPLVLPRTPVIPRLPSEPAAPATPPVSPTIMKEITACLTSIVRTLGTDTTLNLLAAAAEKVR